MSHVTYEGAMSHTNESCTHINDSCHQEMHPEWFSSRLTSVYERVMYTYQRLLPHANVTDMVVVDV